MCTAIRIKSKDTYFGRNLDLSYSFGQEVILTPRNHPFSFTDGTKVDSHPAILGIGTIANGYPLYADAFNENGLAIAGLNFPGNAFFFKPVEGKTNVSPFEWIPYLLSHASTIAQAREILRSLNLVDIPFSKSLPLAPLHWIVADDKESIVIESQKDGIHIYDDPFDVLTNNPPFPFHSENMRRYLNLSAKEEKSRFAKDLDLTPFSVGFGSLFLPGDYSSPSRFVKACFLAKNVPLSSDDEIAQQRLFFRILQSVSFLPGAVINPDGTTERTLYSSCMNLSKKTYAYQSENDATTTLVSMDDYDLDGKELLHGPLSSKESLERQRLVLA